MPARILSILAVALVLVSCAPAAAPVVTRAPEPAAPAAKAPAASAVPATPAPAATPKAAAEQPKRGGILDLPAESDPADLDGLWGTSIVAQLFVNPSYNGLIQYDPLNNTRIVPRLAEKWEQSADGKTITFSLRKGVKWHDGKPFGAQDVKATMDLWQTPPAGKMFLGEPLK